MSEHLHSQANFSFYSLTTDSRGVQHTMKGAMCCPAVCLNQLIDDLSAAVVLACLGFLSPANRGALMTCAVVLWVLLGTPAGYVSARLYKSKNETFVVGKLMSRD